MGTPYIGEIRLMSFAFAPKGWAQCNGQLLPINQYQALFALLGTYFGGNGQSNFALPNLQGRTPLHAGPTIGQGQSGGAENVTLLQANLPVHSHGLSGTSDLANANAPGLAVPAAKGRGGANHYAGAGSVDVVLDASSVSSVGGSQPHNNMQPYLVMNYVIALQGIFPSRN